MKRLLWLAIALCLLPSGRAIAQTPPANAELTALLREFLAGASRNDAAVHERFWAEDLVYTASSGRRIGKADILKELRAPAAPTPPSPATDYTAEDIRIQQFGDTAIVAFRLVGTTGPSVMNYLNTGTFLKRGGKWQAVAWQATKMPRPEEEARRAAAAAQDALDRAMRSGDAQALDGVLHERFVWTQRFGDRVTRAQLLEQIGSGQLKYLKLEPRDVAADVHGDAAVVRARSERQRSVFPGSNGAGDPTPFTVFSTLTLVNSGDGWRAVALHTSRAQGADAQGGKAMTKRARGAFEVKVAPQAAGGGEDDMLGRMSLDKRFEGDLEGSGKGQMLTGLTAVKGSAGYVAIERVSGKLAGRSGTFVLQHSGTMTRGAPELRISVVPDSGTGALEALSGQMTIEITDGKHSYDFEYSLAPGQR